MAIILEKTVCFCQVVVTDNNPHCIVFEEARIEPALVICLNHRTNAHRFEQGSSDFGFMAKCESGGSDQLALVHLGEGNDPAAGGELCATLSYARAPTTPAERHDTPEGVAHRPAMALRVREERRTSRSMETDATLKKRIFH